MTETRTGIVVKREIMVAGTLMHERVHSNQEQRLMTSLKGAVSRARGLYGPKHKYQEQAELHKQPVSMHRKFYLNLAMFTNKDFLNEGHHITHDKVERNCS